MKRIFNHTKKPVEDWQNYDESEFDWDVSEDYVSIEEAEEEDGYTEGEELVYSDETEADWLNLAVKNGILKNTENLDDKITREQFAEILSGAAVYKKGALKVDILKASFDDFDSVSPYYKTSVLGVAGVGLMAGDDQGLFNPKKTLTRAEAARTMKRLIYMN